MAVAARSCGSQTPAEKGHTAQPAASSTETASEEVTSELHNLCGQAVPGTVAGGYMGRVSGMEAGTVSKPRYDWWPYVKGMIRRYPALKEEYDSLHSQSVTASYSGMPGGGGAERPVESVSVRELPHNSQREYEAVRRAIELTERYRNGRERLSVVKMVLWDRQYTLDGAALRIPCGIRTAQRWHGEFIRLVAKNYGLFD